MREDWYWIAPSILIIYLQAKVIWGVLPRYNDVETEIVGKRSGNDIFIFFCIENFLKVLGIIQFGVVVLPIIDGVGLFYLRFLGYLFVIFGFVISVWGLNKLGNNWSGMMGYRIIKGQILVTGGIYKWIRHPIYLGLVMEIVGYQLIVNSWLVVPIFVLMFWYVNRHIKKEDKLLEDKYKDLFVKYRSVTKKLIPGIY